MSTTEQQYGMTISQIAEMLGEPMHRINYIVQTHKIAAYRRVGIIREFDAAAVEQIKTAVAKRSD